jgi:hypothetical protein
MPTDYFMRLIDQVAAMLAQVIQKEIAGDGTGAKAELNALCRQTIGLDVSQLQQMSPEAVVQLLDTAAGLRQARAVMLAELLVKDAEMHSGDQRRATLDRLQAFCLLSSTIDSLDLDDQRAYRPKLQLLAERLRQFDSNPYVAAKLQEYESHRQA